MSRVKKRCGSCHTCKRGGLNLDKINKTSRDKSSFLSLPHPVSVFLILSFILSALIFIPSMIFNGDKLAFKIQEHNLFTHIKKAENIAYSILSRKNLDRNGNYSIYLKIETTEQLSKEELVALTQKIVKEVIDRERCYSISLDFGEYGYADFIPENTLTKLSNYSEIDYNTYQLKYVFLN